MKEEIRKQIISGKSFLQKNDLDGFFNTIWNVSSVASALLLETSAPILNYMTKIPSNFLDSNSQVKNLMIPSNIKTIGDEAFEGSNLQSIQMESGVKYMGQRCFAHCLNLEVVDLSDTIENIPREAFEGCTNLKKLFLPDSIKTIGANAFSGCDNIEIIANYRVKDKIRAKKADYEFLKQHLKFTH